MFLLENYAPLATKNLSWKATKYERSFIVSNSDIVGENSLLPIPLGFLPRTLGMENPVFTSMYENVKYSK